MSGAGRNIALFPWLKFFQSLFFWQATWFLYYQSELAAAQAILIYVIFDISTTVLEVPSGYLSDKVGRRLTLGLAAIAGLVSTLMQGLGTEFWVFALAQVALGAQIAFVSGTDSSILYESLAEEGRGAEAERYELIGWRVSFLALAISAISGGALALWGLRLPYFATAAAFAAMAVVVLLMREPARTRVEHVSLREDLAVLKRAMTQPVLAWLFGLSVLMYAFSHVPFVFGQPFILSALSGIGLAAEAPLVSGSVSAAMMIISLGVSIFAPWTRARIGLAATLLLAFALQIGVIAGLSITASTLAVALLLLRMVPDSLSQPFILARIQPLLDSRVRATYLSLRSLLGRLVFAASLLLASTSASSVGEMSFAEIRLIFLAYAGLGVMAFIVLLVTVRGRKI